MNIRYRVELSQSERARLKALLSGGKQARAAPPGVPLHPKARQLAQHGRDRDRRPAQPVPRSTHRHPKPWERRSTWAPCLPCSAAGDVEIWVISSFWCRPASVMSPPREGGDMTPAVGLVSDTGMTLE